MSTRISNTHVHEHHARIRREALAALDEELARLQLTIRSTDARVVALVAREGQLDKLHQVRHARLALFDDDEGSGYRLQEPCVGGEVRKWGALRRAFLFLAGYPGYQAHRPRAFGGPP
jgi:hypothetical protein